MYLNGILYKGWWLCRNFRQCICLISDGFMVNISLKFLINQQKNWCLVGVTPYLKNELSIFLFLLGMLSQINVKCLRQSYIWVVWALFYFLVLWFCLSNFISQITIFCIVHVFRIPSFHNHLKLTITYWNISSHTVIWNNARTS